LSSQSALLGAILIIALVALGGVAYNASKLGKIEKNLEETSKSLQAVSKNQSQALTSMEAKIKQLQSIIADLNKSLESVKSSEAQHYSQAAAKLEQLSKEIATLKEQLKSANSNITGIQEKIKSIEKSIDELSSLLLFPVTVTDATGKPVTIPERPTRIVSLFPSVTEILWAVNASSQVIAVDSYSNYPPVVKKLLENGTLINIDSGWFPSVEKILSVNPDLVIGVDSVSSNHQLKEVLAKYGIPMILLPDADFQDVLDSIIIVGKATGHPAEAAEVAAEMRSMAVEMRNYIGHWLNTTGTPRAKVALVAWVNPLWIAGNGTFQNDIILLAGGLNAYSNITGWSAVSPESLVEANPDVIVITAGHAGLNMTRQDFINTLKSQIGNSVYNITAVKTGRIYFIVGDYNDMMVRPGPRMVKAAYLLSVLLYPQAYGLSLQSIPETISPDTFTLPTPPWQK